MVKITCTSYVKNDISDPSYFFLYIFKTPFCLRKNNFIYIMRNLHFANFYWHLILTSILKFIKLYLWCSHIFAIAVNLKDIFVKWTLLDMKKKHIFLFSILRCDRRNIWPLPSLKQHYYVKESRNIQQQKQII